MTCMLPSPKDYDLDGDGFVLNNDGTRKDYILKSDGKSFRCRCMCNVFKKSYDEDIGWAYWCNACETGYQEE